MPIVKRDIYAGVVMEKQYYFVSDGVQQPLLAKPKSQGRTAEEQQEVNHRQSQLTFIRTVNSTFTPQSWYFTGTFSNKYLPENYKEAKWLARKFLRRIKTAYPSARVALVLGRGKWTGRLHVHAIIDGVSEAAIIEKWQYGEVSRLEHLRVDNYYDGVNHGQDYTGLAIYLHNHWTPEQGGNRWQRTGKLTVCDKEKPSIPKRTYSLHRPPPVPKGYMAVEQKETKGGLYFKYVRIPAKEPGIPFIYRSGTENAPHSGPWASP